MTRILTLGIATTIALASLAGLAAAKGGHDTAALDARDPIGAQEDAMAVDATPLAVGSGQYALPSTTADAASDQMIRHWRGNHVDVVRVGKLENRQALAPAKVAALQSAVDNNRRLRHKLEAHGIEIDTIIGAAPAANGGLTLYTRS